MLNKSVTIRDLFCCETPYVTALFDSCTYPWELLPKLREHIRHLVEQGLPGFTRLADGVLIGEGVTIHPSAIIEAPAIIGVGTEIRPGAYLRGDVITGEGCVIGNSTELKHCILLNHVQVPHYNYVGDSVLGNRSHLGAGAICSNLKSDGKAVVVHGDTEHPTGLRKLGGILGDHADVGCGCVLNPGTVIGKHTQVYPLNSLRGVFPAHAIVKSQTNVVEKRK